jgi:hypothetical protein
MHAQDLQGRDIVARLSCKIPGMLKLSHSGTHLLINQCRGWQAVEAISESPPQPYIVSAFALIIESIDAVDGSAFVIASQQEKVLGVLDLQRRAWPCNNMSLHDVAPSCEISTAGQICLMRNPCTDLEGKQKADGLKALLATVDIVSKKQIVGFGREASVLKKPQEV